MAYGAIMAFDAALYQLQTDRQAPVYQGRGDQHFHVFEIFVAQGVDLDKFNKTFDSFGVVSAAKQADARQRSYGIKGTPEMVVNGKYRLSAKMAGGQGGMLKVADYLIGLERQNITSE